MHIGGIWCDVPAILATRSVLILRLRQAHSCVVLAVYSVDMLTREVCICPSHIPDPHLCSANAPRMLYSGAGLVCMVVTRPPLVIWTHGESISHMACYALVPHVRGWFDGTRRSRFEQQKCSLTLGDAVHPPIFVSMRLRRVRESPRVFSVIFIHQGVHGFYVVRILWGDVSNSLH